MSVGGFRDDVNHEDHEDHEEEILIDWRVSHLYQLEPLVVVHHIHWRLSWQNAEGDLGETLKGIAAMVTYY